MLEKGAGVMHESALGPQESADMAAIVQRAAVLLAPTPDAQALHLLESE